LLILLLVPVIDTLSMIYNKHNAAL